jgi:hypothetical protein
VASRIELQAFMPGNFESLQSELQLEKLRFEPMGFLQFDAPSGKVRELKSAYLPENSKADAVMLLKLLIHGHHPHPLNLFNQVSIIAINCLGSIYEVGGGGTRMPLIKGATIHNNAISSLTLKNNSAKYTTLLLPVSTGRFEEEMMYDLSTVEKLKELDEAKR